MKIIQCLSDIEYLRAEKLLPIAFIKEITQDFLGIYDAEKQDDIYLLNYRLPLMQALYVLEKGDNVVGKLNDPFSLEYVEKNEVERIVYYRCALRKGEDFQIYYSLLNTHDKKIEDWLQEQAEWNKGNGDF